MTQLDELYDPALELPETDLAALEQVQIERVRTWLAVTQLAGDMQRRLPSGATRADLALDKKQCRRLRHALGTAYALWDNKRTPLGRGKELKPYLADEALVQEAAQAVWESWVLERCEVLSGIQVKLACHAVNLDKRKWGNIALNRITNERNGLQWAMRG